MSLTDKAREQVLLNGLWDTDECARTMPAVVAGIIERTTAHLKLALDVVDVAGRFSYADSEEEERQAAIDMRSALVAFEREVGEVQRAILDSRTQFGIEFVGFASPQKCIR